MPNAILDPTGVTGTAAGTRKTAAEPRASRPGSLRGATVGLLVNTKQNAAPFLDEVGRLLTERHGARALVTRTKVNFAQPEREDTIKDMAESCDVIVTGIGDCGSCSASAVADGIAFEAAGLPAAVICSDAFKVTADAMRMVGTRPSHNSLTSPSDRLSRACIGVQVCSRSTGSLVLAEIQAVTPADRAEHAARRPPYKQRQEAIWISSPAMSSGLLSPTSSAYVDSRYRRGE